jgi:diacylglycerol kinase family enzyme
MDEHSGMLYSWHTVAQGLLGRPDWQDVAQVPIALLPAGSGNALSANTGMWDLPTALHAVIKAGTRYRFERLD